MYKSPLLLRKRIINRSTTTSSSSSNSSTTTTTTTTTSSSTTTSNCSSSCSSSSYTSTSSSETTFYYENENDLEKHHSDNSGENNDKLLVSLTQRGKPKLCYCGYYYTIDRGNADSFDKIEWKCERASNTTKYAKCCGRVHTNGLYEPIIVITEHNHVPVPEKQECMLVLNEMLERAKITQDNPRTIIKNCQTNLSLEAASIMCRQNNIRQRMLRKRNDLIEYGNCGTDLDSLNIPTELRYTFDQKNFLLYDSLEDGFETRILIFATDENIAILSNSNAWYCDGTFDVCPLLFMQLFTINIIFNGKNLPMVYALLPNKKEESYVKVFEEVKKVISSAPNVITTDFEKGLLNAISSTFPSVNINGCYFHLTQNLWKNIQSKGLSKSYVENQNIRKAFKYLKSLAFVPVKDVIYAFNQIQNSSPAEFKPILEYFEKFYIGVIENDNEKVTKSKGRPPKLVVKQRLVPFFPINLWNVNSRIATNSPRTNNSIEAWHKAFENDAKKHPSVNKLIYQLKLEQKNTEILFQQLKSGDTYSRKKSEIDKDKKIEQIISEYDKNNLINFFDNISLLL